MALETDAEVVRVLAAVERAGRVDLEAVEAALVAAVLQGGKKILESLLCGVGQGRGTGPVRCRYGTLMQSQGLRGKWIQTLLGWVRFVRSRYACPCCGETRYPGDEVLDVVDTSYSPGVRRQVARLAAKETFREVATDLRELAQVDLCRKDAERIAENVGTQMETWMAREHQAQRYQPAPPPETPKTIKTLYIELDGTGIPMVPHELAGRPGKQEDGSAKTREAKVGCVFTQTTGEEQGKPVRDPRATSYVSAIEAAEPFGWRLYGEAVRRGLFLAQRVVVLGDGAEWVKNLAQTHFGMAQFIIDYYHASEHLGELCRALFDRDHQRSNACREHWTDVLWHGAIETLIQEATALLPKDPNAKPEARKQIAYFEKNKDHMRYATYRQQGWFIGSGVIEAACKNLVGYRCKQSGMEWTVTGANAILALRCVILSNRHEEFWEQRAA